MATSIFTNDLEIQRLNKQYVSGYTALYELFLKNVVINSAVEGSTTTKSISLNDLNLGKIKKADTEIAKTTAIETSTSFVKEFYLTEVQKSDYQAEGIESFNNKVLDGLKREYDNRFINGDGINKGLLQSTSTENYNIMTGENKPTSGQTAVNLVKRMLRLSLKAGNGEKVLIPFGTFAATLDTEITGTTTSYKQYILENTKGWNLEFIDPTVVEGISLTGNGGLLVVDLMSTALQMIREPNLKKIMEDKMGNSYIYESSTNACDPQTTNSIVRIDFNN